MNTNDEKDIDLTKKNDGADLDDDTTDVDDDKDDDQANDDGAGDDKSNKKDDKSNKKDNKSIETPEAKRARLKRQLEQLDKKHPPVEDKSNKQANKSDEFDYGQEAYLIANGIKDESEVDLAKQFMKDTGKSLKEVVNNKRFQAELKDLREDTSTANAGQMKSKRSGQSQSNTVEYWLAKGELPPASETKLRQDVVNARIKSEGSKNVFSNNPVVGKA